MENTITITREEYDMMLIAKHTLDNIRTMALKDDCSYGYYSAGTTLIIDVLLGIERKEKAD